MAKTKSITKRQQQRITDAVMASVSMRDELKAIAAQRRDTDAHRALLMREERWGGIRSLMLVTVISAVMVGMLYAGVMGG